jgi:transcriptional regulator with XRE-family HTH domain
MAQTISPDRGPRVDLYADGLRQLRERSGLTQLDLAVRAGLTPATISRLENGHQSPTLVTAEALSEALGIHLAELLGAVVSARPLRPRRSES